MDESRPDNWDDLIGETMGPDGRYTILRRVGEGGMGVVFLAEEKEKQRCIAVKILDPHGGIDTEALQRFKREGRKFGILRHPNVVRVYGMGRAHGFLYIASEFVDGKNLWELVRDDGPMTIERALHVVSDAASGLQLAHENGIIHRDLKPENIMITSAEGVVKLLDFGIAKDLNASLALTVKGTYLGTPAYSSPEQIQGHVITPQSDVFSLGVILYELVTGEVPFKGDKTVHVLLNTIKSKPICPTKLSEEVTRPVAKLISRMIEKKPEKRPDGCAEVLKQIADVQEFLAKKSKGSERRFSGEILKQFFQKR